MLSRPLFFTSKVKKTCRSRLNVGDTHARVKQSRADSNAGTNSDPARIMRAAGLVDLKHTPISAKISALLKPALVSGTAQTRVKRTWRLSGSGQHPKVKFLRFSDFAGLASVKTLALVATLLSLTCKTLCSTSCDAFSLGPLLHREPLL